MEDRVDARKKQWESDIILRVKIKETGTHHPKMNCIPVYHVMLPFFYDGCEAGDYYSGAEYRCGGKDPHSSSEKRIIRTSHLLVKSSDYLDLVPAIGFEPMTLRV